MGTGLILLILVVVVLLTALIVHLFTDKIKNNSKYINVFAASIVASLIFVHILPDLYEVKSFWIGFSLMIGMVFQLFLEKITNGIAHGHVHSHSENHRSIVMGLLIGIGLHAFVEGTPLLLSSEIQETNIHQGHNHASINNSLDEKSFEINSDFITAIITHKIPVTIVLSLFFISIGIKKRYFFALILLFAVMTPLGSLAGLLLSESLNLQLYTSYFMAFSTGMLLHIITAILFEHSHDKKESNAHIIIISTGIVIGSLLFYF